MSDAKSGGDSPTRPGTNDAVSVVSGVSGQDTTHQQRPPRRRTKRPRSQKSAIRADNLIIEPPNGDGSGIAPCDIQSPKLSTPDGVLGETKSSKRRRRRRRNRKSNGDGIDGAADQQLTTATETSMDNGANHQSSTPASGPSGRATSKLQTNNAPSNNRNNRRNRRRRNNQRQDQHDAKHGVPGHEAAGQGNQPNGFKRSPTDEQKNTDKSPKRDTGHHAAKSKKQGRGSDLYAALDLGTNNCRLLVALPQQPGRFRVVDAFSKIVRLGEGLAATGALSQGAMDRAVGALKSCSEKLTNKNIKGVRLIATEACRRAVNGVDFLERVEREAGLKLEIVDRETEARLAVAGCASLVDRKAKGVVLFDIGGGSSELALLDLRRRKKYDLSRAMVSWTSLPMGVVTLSEKHGGGKHVTRQIFDGMVAEVAEHLSRFDGRDALSEAADQGEIHLLGTSGTVTTLAGIHLKLPRYDRRQVDGTWMASDDVDAMIEALVEMDFEQRVANPCIGRDRADLVLAGCAILVAIQQLWPCPRLRVADRGLREGLLTEMMNADNAWVRRPKYFRHKRN